MTTIIKLIRHESDFQNVADGFSIFDGEKLDDSCQILEEYVLPAGYKIRRTVAEELAVFAQESNHGCDLICDYNGRPVIIADAGPITLSLAKPVRHDEP